MKLLGVLAIFLAALVILGVGIEKTKIAAAFSDPVSRIRAQDESIYANGSIAMALHGDWLTPKVLGRIFLFKPPLQLWLSGLSLKLFGISLLALRLPMLIAGSLGAVLVYCWCAPAGFGRAGIVGVLLLLSDPVWHTFSRLCYTDILLAVFTMAALYCVVLDPLLQRRSTFLGFCIATAAAIMTKSVAGVVPILVLLLAAVWNPPGQRLTFRRIVQACLLTALFIAPWHMYQLIAHPRWFWADYVQLELLRIGLQPPLATTAESPLVFYGRRLFLLDPSLSILALIAVPGLAMAVRRRESIRPVLLAAWLIVVLAAMCAFQTRFFHYVVFLIAPLCIAAACYGPWSSPRWRWLIIVALCIAFGVKTLVQDRVWSLTFGVGPPLPAASILRPYSDLARPNALVLVDSDDDFYGATLPLRKVHYCFLDPNRIIERYAPHYPHLGITVTAGQFAELDRLTPQFRDNLRAWGLDSIAPLATAIEARSDSDVLNIIRTHPLDDFYLPARLRQQVVPLVQSTHDISDASSERLLLFARRAPAGVIAPDVSRWSKNW
jgi:4-amino-4-deoxy-L-arabinose transferase-like glycosyltransferase